MGILHTFKYFPTKIIVSENSFEEHENLKIYSLTAEILVET